MIVDDLGQVFKPYMNQGVASPRPPSGLHSLLAVCVPLMHSHSLACSCKTSRDLSKFPLLHTCLLNLSFSYYIPDLRQGHRFNMHRRRRITRKQYIASYQQLVNVSYTSVFFFFSLFYPNWPGFEFENFKVYDVILLIIYYYDNSLCISFLFCGTLYNNTLAKLPLVEL